MEKFEINIDRNLKEKMQNYDTDWSEVCRTAIQDEINRLEGVKTNVEQLIDTNIDNVFSVRNESKIPELPRKVYKIFEQAWKEVFGDDPYRAKNHIAPPSSNKLKKWWKTWYNPDYWSEPEYPFNDLDDFILTLSINNDQDILTDTFYHKAIESESDVWAYPQYTCFVYFISRFLFNDRILEFNEIDPFLLENVDIEDRDNLPEESGIYFVRDDQNLYYIGMTKNLQERWYDHHRQDDFDKISNLKIAYLKGVPQHYLKKMETTLIEYFEPQLNITNNPLIKK